MKKSIFKRIAASAAAMTLALVGVVALGAKADEVKAATTDVDLSTLTGYTLSGNLFKVCEDWSGEVTVDEDVTVSFQLSKVDDSTEMTAMQLMYCDGGWAWHHDYIDAVYSEDETYKFVVPAGTYHMFQFLPSSAKDGDGDKTGTVCWNYEYKNVKATVGEEEPEASYYVAGASGLCGVDWKESDPSGLMTKNSDGIYTITYTGVNAGTYEFKITDGTWDDAWNLEGSANFGAPNASVTVEEDDSTVVITFDGEKASVEVNPEIPDEPDEPSTDEPATDEPATDEPSTDEPSTDEPSTDEPATDVPSGDSARTALIVALVFAGVASVAAVVSKKVTVAEK